MPRRSVLVATVLGLLAAACACAAFAIVFVSSAHGHGLAYPDRRAVWLLSLAAAGSGIAAVWFIVRPRGVDGRADEGHTGRDEA